MSAYKTLLSVIQNEQEAPALIDSSIRLARTFDAHLIGCHPEPLPTDYAFVDGFPDAGFIGATTEQSMERTRNIAGSFSDRTASSGVSAAWGNPDTGFGSVVGLARSVDLVIAAQPAESDSSEIDNLLHEGGRPVLVVPGECREAFDHVIIGWNGSKQSSSAAFAALPFLERARTVELVELASNPAETDSGTVIVETLRRHGIEANLVHEATGDIPVEEALANRVASEGADLLVIGAYSHSWLREFLFGGVTRQILNNSPVTTLMAH